MKDNSAFLNPGRHGSGVAGSVSKLPLPPPRVLKGTRDLGQRARPWNKDDSAQTMPRRPESRPVFLTLEGAGATTCRMRRSVLPPADDADWEQGQGKVER
jgi:hypothetical protein